VNRQRLGESFNPDRGRTPSIGRNSGNFPHFSLNTSNNKSIMKDINHALDKSQNDFNY
jgi:hypothetical protein